MNTENHYDSPRPTSPKLQFAIVILSYFFLIAVSQFFPGFQSDMWCWRNWSAHMLKHGLANAYNGSGSDYLPLYQYMLWIFGHIQGSVESINRNIGVVRFYTLIFDYWGLWIVAKWADRKHFFVLIVCFSMFNLAYSYNTLLWGQVDGIEATLVLAAIYAAWRRKSVLSGILMVLALNMKLQALPFIPVWGILVLYDIITSRKWGKLGVIAMAIILVQIAILVPFGWKGAKAVINVVVNSAAKYPAISMNAYNLWFMLIGNKAWSTMDSSLCFVGMTYKQVGILLFLLVGFFALFPLIKLVYKSIINKGQIEIDRKLVWTTSALVAMVFFFFLSEMHERYAHPAFIFLTAYAFYTRRYGLYAVFSAAYLLNLEKVLQALRLPNYNTFVFNERFIAGLYLLCIIWLFIVLYRFQLSPKKQSIIQTSN